MGFWSKVGNAVSSVTSTVGNVVEDVADAVVDTTQDGVDAATDFICENTGSVGCVAANIVGGTIPVEHDVAEETPIIITLADSCAIPTNEETVKVSKSL